LSLPKWRAILTIQRIPCCSMGELSAYTTVDRTTLTRTVDQLVAEGLVQRVATPNDRRQVHLVLTDLGAEAYQAAVAPLLARLRGCSRTLNVVALTARPGYIRTPMTDSSPDAVPLQRDPATRARAAGGAPCSLVRLSPLPVPLLPVTYP
ncbi:MarR family transcriptional regulator, partial [Pandoraea nosoerga]|nr:MarR family transcriptional regulator [Pandoraea nosoerga]